MLSSASGATDLIVLRNFASGTRWRSGSAARYSSMVLGLAATGILLMNLKCARSCPTSNVQSPTSVLHRNLRVSCQRFTSSVVAGRWTVGFWTLDISWRLGGRVLRRGSTAAYLVGIPKSESDAETASHSL